MFKNPKLFILDHAKLRIPANIHIWKAGTSDYLAVLHENDEAIIKIVATNFPSMDKVTKCKAKPLI